MYYRLVSLLFCSTLLLSFAYTGNNNFFTQLRENVEQLPPLYEATLTDTRHELAELEHILLTVESTHKKAPVGSRTHTITRAFLKTYTQLSLDMFSTLKQHEARILCDQLTQLDTDIRCTLAHNLPADLAREMLTLNAHMRLLLAPHWYPVGPWQESLPSELRRYISRHPAATMLTGVLSVALIASWYRNR